MHGCVFAVQTRDGHFHDTHSNLLENITFQAGAVLDNCAALQQHRDNALHHQTSSLQLIQVVNKREIEGVIRHIEEMMPTYMCCQRAVLYMIDWDRGVVWTLLPDDELLTYDIVPEAMSMSKGEGKIGSEGEESQTQSEVNPPNPKKTPTRLRIAHAKEKLSFEAVNPLDCSIPKP